MRNKNTWKIIFACCFIFMTAHAQTPDILRVEYMVMPENKADVQLSRIKLVANIPIKIREKDNIIIGAEYNGLQYELQREVPFEKEAFKNFHVIDLNLAYVLQYTPEWRLIGVVTPRVSSTLNDGLQNEDVSLNVTVGAFREIKNTDKPTKLVLGIAYNSTVAVRVPLPVIYYEKRFDPHWTYVIGAPKSAMKYHLNEKSLFQTEFILDGYYSNLQDNIILPNGASATAISSSAGLVTLGYQYALGKNIFVYGYMGHTLFQKGMLRNDKRKNSYTLNDEPSLYFRTGFRIGL